MATGQDLVNLARQQVADGDPYVWGAEGPDAFDCSGLVDYVARSFGFSVPRVTYDQYAQLPQITRDELRPGDLIFSHWGSDKAASHVGIYAGNNEIIEAPQAGRTVTVTKLNDSYWSHVDGYRRIPGVNGAAGSDGGGGTGGGLTEIAAGFASGVSGVPSAVFSALLSPFDAADTLTQAASQVAEAGRGAALGLLQMGNVASMITKLFLPNNMIRGVCLAIGAVFMLLGIWFLAREVKSSTPA